MRLMRLYRLLEDDLQAPTGSFERMVATRSIAHPMRRTEIRRMRNSSLGVSWRRESRTRSASGERSRPSYRCFPVSAPLTQPPLARSSLLLVNLALASGCAGDEFTACKGDACAHTATGGTSAGSGSESSGTGGSAGAGNSGDGGDGGVSAPGNNGPGAGGSAVVGAGGSKPGTGGEGGAGGTAMTTSSGGSQTAGSGDSSTGGGSAEPESTSASGSRLKLRYLEASDGATMVLDFWDKDLDVPCGFDEGVDGTLNCTIDGSLIGEAIFADAACNQPVYGEDEQACNAGWVRANASGSLYRATTTPAFLEGSHGYFVETFDGDCRESGIIPTGNYYEAELVPSSSFVGGDIETEERQDALVTRYAVGDDGSRILVGTWFEEREYQCAFDERGYCLPVDRIQPEVSYFGDDACSTKAFGFYGEPPMISQKSTSDYCSALEFFERGTEITAGALYSLDPTDTCVEVTPDYGTYNFFRLGTKISLSTIPKAKREMLGVGSLVARRWVDSAGEPLTEVDEFWDTTRDEACTPYETGSGGYVCVSKNYAYVEGNEHLDESCSDTDQRAYAICPPETPRVAVRFGQPSCEVANMFTLEAAYGVGAPLGVDYYFENANVTCEQRSMPDVYSAYETDESLLDELPVLELVIDE